MPELRQDLVTRNWVAVATERARRPTDFAAPRERIIAPIETCPFCPGNEHLTPPEVFAVRKNGAVADSTGWTVRVVPNKYPAFCTDGRDPDARPELVIVKTLEREIKIVRTR